MQEWSEQEIEKLAKERDDAFLYLYTPMCGTCQVAGKMMEVAAAVLPDATVGKANLNYLPALAADWGIESVPCLVVLCSGEPLEKYYAFHSVPYLIEQMKAQMEKRN